MAASDRAHNSIYTCVSAKAQAVEIPSQNVMGAGLICFAQPGQTAPDTEMKLGVLIIDGRGFLENLVQKPVVDFAYPYGDCGPREGTLVAGEGFRSAVTARSGSIWPQHKNWPHALPRIGINMNESCAVVDGRISGVRGLLNPGQRVVVW